MQILTFFKKSKQKKVKILKYDICFEILHMTTFFIIFHYSSFINYILINQRQNFLRLNFSVENLLKNIIQFINGYFAI